MVSKAWEALTQARTVKGLHQAQAVILPLEFGFSLDMLIMPHVNSVCMQIFLNEVASRYPEERLLATSKNKFRGVH